MWKIFLMLPVCLAWLPGCFGCGGSREMLIDSPMETEDERIRRLTIAVVRELELEQAQREQVVSPAAVVTPQRVKRMVVDPPSRKAFGIEDVSAAVRLITFSADSMTVVSMNPGRFGHVRKLSIVDGPDRWQLKVNARYDFVEVVTYLRSFE